MYRTLSMSGLLAAMVSLSASHTATAQKYHFSKDLGRGGTVEISNINGDVVVSRASGSVAEINVTKTVKRGNGALVTAVMETDDNEIHVCTVYLEDADDKPRDCDGHRNHQGNRVSAEMRYEVRLPAGADLEIENVNGDVTVRGAGADASIELVNGVIDFEGAGASSLQSVNGDITATVTRGTWTGSMDVESVNGSITLTLPGDLSARIHGSTVNGKVDSDFAVKMSRFPGPRSFSGTVGDGAGRLSVETVNGSITLRKH